MYQTYGEAGVVEKFEGRTPGTWVAEYHSGAGWAVMLADGEYKGASIATGLVAPNCDREEAGINANLFAAAPTLLRERDALVKALEWQPIKTAPKNQKVRGLLLIGQYPNRKIWSDIYHCWWDAHLEGRGRGGWVRWTHNFPPTHWRLLPNPPSAIVAAVAAKAVP